MTRRLVIANKTYSSWSMRPWLLMRAFAIPFDEIVIPLDSPHARAEILRRNPAGKVPVLEDGDLVIWDSLAIIEHLAERHPEHAIWPRDPAARALARSLAAEMHSGFSALRRHLPMNMRRDSRPATLEAEMEATRDRLADTIDQLVHRASPKTIARREVASAIAATSVSRCDASRANSSPTLFRAACASARPAASA